MKTEPFREMNEGEKALIQKLLTPKFPGRDELTHQIKMAQVKILDEDGSLGILVDSGIPTDRFKHAVPTEGEYEDSDGVTVHVLLHVVDGSAKELEFFREDNRRVQTWPDPDLIRVFAPA